MNNDEKFEKRWEFRRGEVDGDTSSDDNRSNSIHDPANKNHKLVLVENDEASDDLECQTRHNKLEETKNQSNKKKKWEGCAVSENKKKRKVNNNEIVTLKDLKIFANSLIHELSVTRENMFANMREEMKKLGSSESNILPVKKNVRRSQKKNVASDVRKVPKAVAENEKNEPRRTNKQQKSDKLRPSAMVHMNHQLVSSPNIHLPVVLPKQQFQTQRNGVLLNDHIPINNSLGLEEIEIGKLMAAKRFSNQIVEFQQQQEERFGSFSHNHQKSSMGLLAQNSCIQGIGFPIPLIQGTSNGSNTSSLTYCENSFVDNHGVGVRMNGSIARFPGWS